MTRRLTSSMLEWTDLPLCVSLHCGSPFLKSCFCVTRVGPGKELMPVRICRFNDAPESSFPLVVCSLVKVKQATSKLRLGQGRYEMEVMVGDSTKQLEMRLDHNLIQAHIGRLFLPCLSAIILQSRIRNAAQFGLDLTPYGCYSSSHPSQRLLLLLAACQSSRVALQDVIHSNSLLR